MPASPLLRLALLGLTLPGPSVGRQQASACLNPPPQATLEQTVAAAVHRLLEAHAAETRFTRFHLEHNQVFQEDGRALPPHDKMYEDTWINNLPYKHLLQVDGKPLTGSALLAEQTRLDRALADHRSLDLAERARQTHGRLFSTDINLRDVATAAYTLRFLHTDTCAGTPCRVYSADPADPNAHPTSFELWVVDAPGPFLFRVTYELTADRGGLHKGSTGLLEYELFDDVPVERHTLFTGFVLVKGRFLRIATDNTFTRYRRFSTSITIRQASEPASSGPDPSQRPE